MVHEDPILEERYFEIFPALNNGIEQCLKHSIVHQCQRNCVTPHTWHCDSIILAAFTGYTLPELCSLDHRLFLIYTNRFLTIDETAKKFDMKF